MVKALHQLLNKNAVEPVTTQKSLGFYKTFSGPKTQQPVETYPGPQCPEQIFKDSHSKWRHQRQQEPPYRQVSGLSP